MTSGGKLIKLRKRQLPQHPRHVSVMQRKSKVPLGDSFHTHICSIYGNIYKSHKVFHSTSCDDFFTVAADEPCRLQFSVKFKKITRSKPKLVKNVSTSTCNPPFNNSMFLAVNWSSHWTHWHRFRHDLACFRLIADI